MLKRIIISFLMITLLVLTLIYPSLSFASQSSYLIPMDSAKWIGTGQIRSIKTNHTNKNSLEWKPQKKSSYLKSYSVPLNWSQYQEMEITLSCNLATDSWINIIICDKNKSPAVTFIEIDFTGAKTFHLTFKDSFPSFNQTDQIDWKQIAYFAFETHSVADLDIAKLEMTIEKIEIKMKEEKKAVPTPSLSLYQKKSLFFPDSLFTSLEQNQVPVVQKLKQRVATIAQNAVLTKEMSSESLFYIALDAKIHHKPLDFSVLTRYAPLFQKTYWDSLMSLNDVLVQENGLFFLLVFDLLRIDLVSYPNTENQFLSILEYLAEIELNQCNYWINSYPYGQGNNHVTRAASFLAILAYFHENIARRSSYYQYALSVLDYYFGFQIDHEGVLNEGTHYYVYLMEVLAYFGYFEWVAQARSIFQDFSFSTKLERMMDWANAIKMPNGFLPALDDAWQTKVTFPPRLVIPFLDDKNKANTNSNCYDSSNFFENYAWNIEKPLYIPLFLFGSGETFDTNGLNEFPSRVFSKENQIVFRKNWSPESSYLFFSGKQQSSLHEHDDAGQIQLYAHQNLILLESGYGPSGWSSAHRDYYTSGSAHNTVTIDSVGPKAYYNGSIGPVDQSTLLETRISYPVQYAYMEIKRNTLFTGTKWVRSVFYVPETSDTPYYCVVLDQLSSPKERLYECLFHPNGSDIRQNGSLTTYKMTLPNRQGSIITELHALIPKPTEIKNGFFSAYWGHETSTRYVNYKEKSKDCAFATMITSKTDQDPAIVSPIPFSGKRDKNVDEYAFSIQKNQESFQDMLFRNPFGNMVQGQWIGSNATTAYIRANKRQQKNESFISVQGSYLNYQQEPLFYAQKKIDYLYFTSSSELYDYFMEYESSAIENTIYMNLFDISKILLDNKEVRLNSFSGGISFHLPPGKHQIILFKKEDI